MYLMFTHASWLHFSLHLIILRLSSTLFGAVSRTSHRLDPLTEIKGKQTLSTTTVNVRRDFLLNSKQFKHKHFNTGIANFLPTTDAFHLGQQTTMNSWGTPSNLIGANPWWWVQETRADGCNERLIIQSDLTASLWEFWWDLRNIYWPRSRDVGLERRISIIRSISYLIPVFKRSKLIYWYAGRLSTHIT